MVLGVISALLLCFEKLSTGRKAQVATPQTPRIVTLQEVLRHHEALPATARAFYEALLAQGEVLAVQVEYLPDPLLWLTTTPEQAQWMREQHNGSAGLICGDERGRCSRPAGRDGQCDAEHAA
jgi:hypothetical protein